MQPHNYPILIQLKGHLEFTIFKKQAILLLKKKKGKQPISHHQCINHQRGPGVIELVLFLI